MASKQIPWNKGISGYSTSWKGGSHSEETKKKISESRKGKASGEDAYQWLGDRVRYRALHERFGKAKKCVVCASSGGKIRGCHWANLSGKYKPKQSDFISLCPSCHRRWDRGMLPINLFEWQERLVEY